MLPPDLVRELIVVGERAGLGDFPPPPVDSSDVAAMETWYGDLWADIAQRTDDEFLGMGPRPMRGGSYALLCRCLTGTETFEAALLRALDFFHTLLDFPKVDLVSEGAAARLVMHGRFPYDRPFAYMTFWVLVHGIAGWLVGRRVPLLQVDMPFAEQPGDVAYVAHFCAPVRFDQYPGGFSFSSRHLSLPVIRTQANLDQFVAQFPFSMPRRYFGGQGLAGVIRQRLIATSLNGWPSLTSLAREFDLSEGTLKRRLRKVGYNYRTLREEVRRDMAIRELVHTDRPIAEISELVGFSEPSVFYRAFHRWTHHSPGDFRR